MTFDSRRVILYGILPTAVGLGLVALYFSGVDWMQTLASPAGAREFGLIENLQNLLLLAALALCFRSAGLEESPGWRRAWRVLAVLALLVLLEELDWGMQYYAAFSGTIPDEATPFNLHTQGDFSRYFKRAMDWAMVPVFLVLPLCARKLPAHLRVFVPDVHSILLLVAAFVVSQTAHWLDDAGWTHNLSLHNNISEFREVFTYWLGLLYLWELTRRRRAEA